MKILHKVRLAVLVSAFISGVAFAAASKPASDLATKMYCDAKAAGNPISEEEAARNAATQLGLPSGVEILVNTACDNSPFEVYSNASGAAAGGGVAALSVTTPALLIGGGILLAAAVSGGGGGDTPASP